MHRSKDILKLSLHMSKFKDVVIIDLVQWLLDYNNIALTNGDDYCLFELDSPGVYSGHYFCNNHGRKVIDFSKECLNYIFTETPCRVLKGLTPEDKKAAKWMSRQVGFTSYGIVTTDLGPHTLFILTKKEWETKQ